MAKRIDASDEVKEILRRELPKLKTEFGVKRIGLFGSFSSGKQKQSSDVDLLIEFEKPIGFKFMIMAEYLEKRLGRKVDILTLAGVDSIRVRPIAKSILSSVVYV
ncbi:MAG: nucleotidyltransferase domain-containing protein [Chrysiogenales bacterium]